MKIRMPIDIVSAFRNTYKDQDYYSRRLLRNVLPAYPGADVPWRGYRFVENPPSIYRFIFGLRVSYLLRHLFSIGRIRKVESNIRSISEKMVGRHAGPSPDKLLLYLMRYVSAKRFSQNDYVHVEIGTLHGGSLIATLMALQDAHSSHKVICIDPLDGYYGGAIDPQSAVPVDRETVEENVNRFGFSRSQVEIIQHYSTEKEAIGAVRERKVASLFIDGDHSYEGVKADWVNYAPFVVRGGYALFDNYNDPNFPDITAFVHRELKGCPEGWRIAGSMNISLLLRRRS